MVDKLIIGAGLYGLYSALYCAKKGQEVVVLEIDAAPFMRATYINQARVHMGYHYPRSLSTAIKSAGYFKRFAYDYDFCIHKRFQQIYATSRNFSWTDAKEFKKFCKDAVIPCMDYPVGQYFKEGLCDGAFLTEEYTYDAHILRDYFLKELEKYPNARINCNRTITSIEKRGKVFEVRVLCQGKEEIYETSYVLNATYASVNQVLDKVHGMQTEDFKLKYELCEIILCKVNEQLRDIGVTVMDGPFFSIMPFGKTGYHSLTSVTFTPHETSYERVPDFACMNKRLSSISEEEHKKVSLECSIYLGNCNECKYRPESAWEYMSALARKYMLDEYKFVYEKSLFSMKPILRASEVDDSRPTVIKVSSVGPTFVSVLSGKINTVYDLDEFLDM